MALRFKARGRMFPRRRRFSRGGFRKFARKKYDQVLLLDTMALCHPNQSNTCNLEGDPQPCGPGVADCCENLITLPVVTNARLQGIGTAAPTPGVVNLSSLGIGVSDNVKIVKLFGDIWIRDRIDWFNFVSKCDSYTTATDLPSYAQYFERYALMLRLGLHKAFVTQTDETGPGFDFADPLNPQDWTEGRWFWQRQVYWEPRARFEETRDMAGNLVLCSDTSGGNSLNPITDGTGNINTSVSTNCRAVPLNNPEVSGLCTGYHRTLGFAPPPLFHFRFSVRPRFGVRLKTDEQLNLQIGYKHPTSTQDFLNGPGWGCAAITTDPDTVGGEATQLSAHVMCRAVVQMN